MEDNARGGGPTTPHRDPSATEVIAVRDVLIVEDGEVLDEIIDIEIFIKEGRPIHPRAKGYMVRIDKQKYLFEKPEVTGVQILLKAEKTPADKYVLRQILKGGALEKIELDQVVDLARHGVEKFKTMLKTAQDGRN